MELLRPVGTEFVLPDKPTIWCVVGYRNPLNFSKPPTHEIIEEVGEFRDGEKRYYDGRVEYVPSWQI